MIGACAWRSSRCYLRQHCGGRREHIKQLFVRRVIVRNEVDAEPSGTLSGEVCCVPTDGIDEVRDRPPDVPREVARRDGPVLLDARFEHAAAGGRGVEKVIRAHVLKFSVDRAPQLERCSVVPRCCVHPRMQ